MEYLIVGLGNIGAEYELTRHNAGFLAVDRLADREKVPFTTDRFADKASFRTKGKTVHLIKPNTYMNLSGKAVRYWMQQLGIKQEHVLVVVDDVALPFGVLRMRQRGSSAGHNGLRNIEELLGSQDYPRLRIGIGNDFPKGKQVDYVLGRFTDDEFAQMTTVLDKACDMILSFCLAGIVNTMNTYNN